MRLLVHRLDLFSFSFVVKLKKQNQQTKKTLDDDDDDDTYTLGSDAVLDVLGELSVVGLDVVGLQLLHVVGDVQAEYVATVHVGLELLLVGVVAREALDAVWHMEAAVGGALERGEDLGAGGGARQADVQVAGERARLTVDILHVELGAVDLLGAGVDLVELELLEHAASQQQTGGVRARVVGQADLEAVARQLVRVRGRQHNVALNARIHDLFDNTMTMMMMMMMTQPCLDDDDDLVMYCSTLTCVVTSRLEKRTTKRYLGVLYLFFSWMMRRLRA